MSNLNIILSKLDKVKPIGKKYIARCPAHKDGRPSLLISEETNKVGLHCFAGCHIDDIMSDIGMSTKDLYFDTEYDKSKWRLEKLCDKAKTLKATLSIYDKDMDTGKSVDKAKYADLIKEFMATQSQIRRLM